MSENSAFGMLVAGNSVNALQVCSIARFVVHNDVRRYSWAGNTTDEIWPARRKATTPRQGL